MAATQNVQRPIAIPEPTNDPDSLWRTTQALKEAIEVFQGIRGNREYALLCDLEAATTIINNITGGVPVPPIPGITSFFGLTDTDLTTQAQYDLVFNADGLEWQNTAGELQWNPTADYLQLANDHSINWLNDAAASIELLIFTGSFTGGISSDWGSDPNTDYTYVGITHDTTALEATGILKDVANGLDVFDVSDDGLQCLMGNNTQDVMRSYTLVTPYDFSNATSTGAANSVLNPWHTVCGLIVVTSTWFS
ncbi:unnamed protein product, partial [marine sediment metagenome]